MKIIKYYGRISFVETLSLINPCDKLAELTCGKYLTYVIFE
jgi:hypothetical protein